MNKELIKQRFRRKLNSYSENAKIQKQMAEKLINLLSGNDYKTILEIGCGTGLLTEFAVSRLNYDRYTAIDIVPECSQYVKEINSDIEFISSDIEDYISTVETKYDLIISNASIQWVENLPELINKLMQKVNDNGVLLFSTFGIENYREIYHVLGKTLPYYSKKQLENLFENYSADIEEEVRIMAFKSPRDVLKHIRQTGVNALSQEAWTKKDLIKFEKEYNTICFNHPTLTYNPIYVKMQNSPIG